MGVLLAILGYATDGLINYIDKFLLSKYNIEPTVIAIYSGVAAFIAGILILLIMGVNPIDTRSLLIVIASGILTQLFLLPYFKALSLDETSRIAPLFQLTPVMVLLASLLLFNEALMVKQYIGGACIIIAGFFLAIKKLDSGILRLRPAFYYMVLADMCTAAAILLFKTGVEQMGFWTVIPYEGIGIGIGGFAILAYPGNLKRMKKATRKLSKKVFIYMSIEEILYIFSRYVRYFALSLIAASLVSVLSGFQPLFVFILGIIFSFFFPKIIKEKVTKDVLILKVSSIILVFVGLFLIFL